MFRKQPALRPVLVALFVSLLLSLASLGSARAVCGTAGRPCTLDVQCCGGFICGPAGLCQAGCRIDGRTIASGTRNPANPCQWCQPSRSALSWSNLPDGSTCDDQNACTGPASCRAGSCVGGAPIDCSDANPCTLDSCDPATGCQHPAKSCDDGNPCTVDACDPATGLCSSASGPSACDDGNPCTADRCAPPAGCVHDPLSGSCDDGNACTTADACRTGACVGGPPPDCDDDNACTIDACDPALGCVHDGGPLLAATEPGAFLVLPDVRASSIAEGARIETLITIYNRSGRDLIAHTSFLNGDRGDARYCYECDFDVRLGPRRKANLVVSRMGSLTRIRDTATGIARTCPHRTGFLTVDAEDTSHRVLTDDVLTGSETVVNYTTGQSFTVDPIAFQGDRGDGNRSFEFDGEEYTKLPSYVETDFLAPDPAGPVTARLVLFTLGFRRQLPPLVDCSVIGWDAADRQYSSSIQFGCFTSVRLQDIDPQFLSTNLDGDGRIRLTCEVFGTGATGEALGGVHGILIQSDGNVTWARHLEPAPVAACPVVLQLESAAGSTPW